MATEFKRGAWPVIASVFLGSLAFLGVAWLIEWGYSRQDSEAFIAGEMCATQGVRYADCRAICADVWRHNVRACRRGAASATVQ